MNRGRGSRQAVILAGMLLLISASSPPVDFRKGRYNNVCKDLRNDALLYFVFVDTRTTAPWTEFDILTTIDSIRVAASWLELQARTGNIALNLKTDFYIGDEYTTIERNLPEESVQAVVSERGLTKGMESLSRWGDYLSRIIGESLYIKQKEGIPQRKRPSNKERLIAHLRDEYRVESVALLFLVNNYYRSDISLAVNTLHNQDVEFAVISYKYPSEIAHSVLELYGAADLHESPFRRTGRKIRMAHRLFPDDIMSDVYARPLHQLEIGEFTRYMIGWNRILEDELDPLLTERFTLLR